MTPNALVGTVDDELNSLRQLLQAGVVLVSAMLAGDDVREELEEWVEQVQAHSNSG